MTKVIKVDRVQSVSEAVRLEKAGANIISVSLAKNSRFDDTRDITTETALAIKQSLINAKYVAEVNFNWEIAQIIELAKNIGFDYLQPNDRNVPDENCLRSLAAEGIKIVYPYIEVSHDSDPDWIFSRFENKKKLNAAYFQLDVFSDYSDDAWKFIKYESPEYPEEFQIEDIDRLAQERPLLISFNYSEQNIVEIFNTFSNIKGISLVLADSIKWSLHHFDYPTCEKVIRQLQVEPVQ